MWLTITLTIVNVIMSLIGNKIIRFSGFDITPIGIILIAWKGENIVLGALLLVFGYGIVHPREFRYLWITLPMGIIIGYLALIVPNAFILIGFYHLVGAISAYALQYFSTKYWVFILMNLSINFIIARFYNMLT